MNIAYMGLQYRGLQEYTWVNNIAIQGFAGVYMGEHSNTEVYMGEHSNTGVYRSIHG